MKLRLIRITFTFALLLGSSAIAVAARSTCRDVFTHLAVRSVVLPITASDVALSELVGQLNEPSNLRDATRYRIRRIELASDGTMTFRGERDFLTSRDSAHVDPRVVTEAYAGTFQTEVVRRVLRSLPGHIYGKLIHLSQDIRSARAAVLYQTDGMSIESARVFDRITTLYVYPSVPDASRAWVERLALKDGQTVTVAVRALVRNSQNELRERSLNIDLPLADILRIASAHAPRMLADLQRAAAEYDVISRDSL